MFNFISLYAQYFHIRSLRKKKGNVKNPDFLNVIKLIYQIIVKF